MANEEKRPSLLRTAEKMRKTMGFDDATDKLESQMQNEELLVEEEQTQDDEFTLALQQIGAVASEGMSNKVVEKILDFYNSQDENKDKLKEKIITISNWCRDTITKINQEEEDWNNKETLRHSLNLVMNYLENGDISHQTFDTILSYLNTFDIENIFEGFLSEDVFNSGYMDEQVENVENEILPILSYVLDNVLDEDKDNVKVDEDADLDEENYTFFDKKVKISDNSKVKFKSESGRFDSNVIGDSNKNSLVFSHDKGVNAPQNAVNSVFYGMIDFMEEKNQIPFEFNINTKTEEFKKSLFEIIKLNQQKDILIDNDDINSINKDDKFKDKVSKFIIDGVEISYNQFNTFKNFEDFKNFQSKVNKMDTQNNELPEILSSRER